MEKTKIRIILVLIVLLGFSLSSFAVLFVEQKKLRAKLDDSERQSGARMEDIVSARKKYYDTVAQEKEALRKQMADSKAQYEELLQTQADTVAEKTQTVTQTTQQTVPVTVTKPKSATKTKSS